MSKIRKKIVYLAPHLSTGGMPQFVLKRVQAMLRSDKFEVYVVEYTQYSTQYIVQRTQLQAILGDRFKTLGYLDSMSQGDRNKKLKSVLKEINPDIVHIDEAPESFDSFNKMPAEIQQWLYSQEWRVIETNHNISFNPNEKRFEPDQYQFCTPYHLETFKDNVASKVIIQYPIENMVKAKELAKSDAMDALGLDSSKTHILNVGLWTPGKNQKEGIEIARIAKSQAPNLQFHFVGNQAENFQDYWKPLMDNVPSNVTVWGERSDVSQFMLASDAFMFNSNWECSPLALREAHSYGLKTFSRQLDQYKDMFPFIVPFSEDLSANASTLIKELTALDIKGENPPKDDFARFTAQLEDAYHATLGQSIDSRSHQLEVDLDVQWCNGPRLHARQLDSGEWRAEFYDDSDLIYTTKQLESDHWYQPSRKWWTDWTIKVYKDDTLYKEYHPNLVGQDLTVEFGSSSLGDTLSFMGQMHMIRERHSIDRLFVKCHKPWLFDWNKYAKIKIYPLAFDQPSTYHSQSVGVYYTMDQPWKQTEHKYDWRQIPLGKIAADRLDLPYHETRPYLAREFTSTRKMNSNHAVIATHSTAQAKYWNHPTGWQETCDWLNKNGIKVYHASREGTSLKGVKQLPEALTDVAAYINTAKVFIGISSGLSWFAWALGAEVIMISGFTDEYVEFEEKCTRIINKQKCHGCWGWDVFDKGDWNWCPSWKGTHRQFECSKEIMPLAVIGTIESVLDYTVK
jgi:autotransporter strand-loop-strand O-heptosyltransferase